MESLIIVGLVLLNFGISWWNCKVTGAMWAESKFLGGFMRVLAWCGAIQAAVGFSSVFILVLVFAGYATHMLPAKYAHAAVSLWYLLVIIPALGTGLIITVHSLIEAWRERSIANIGTAAWNTFSTGYNLYHAASDVPDALSSVKDLFSSDGDGDDALVALVILIVAVALAGGVLLTFALIRRYAVEYVPQPVAA